MRTAKHNDAIFVQVLEDYQYAFRFPLSSFMIERFSDSDPTVMEFGSLTKGEIMRLTQFDSDMKSMFEGGRAWTGEEPGGRAHCADFPMQYCSTPFRFHPPTAVAPTPPPAPLPSAESSDNKVCSHCVRF